MSGAEPPNESLHLTGGIFYSGAPRRILLEPPAGERWAFGGNHSPNTPYGSEASRAHHWSLAQVERGLVWQILVLPFGARSRDPAMSPSRQLVRHMINARTLLRWTGLAMLSVCVACTVRARSPEADAVSGTSLSVAEAQEVRDRIGDSDRDLFDIAREAPGFAGVARDPRDEGLILYLTHRDNEPAVRTRAAVLFADPGSDVDSREVAEIAAGFRVQIVKYDFVQLATWFAALWPLMTTPGVTGMALDVLENQVYVGVASDEDVASVTAAVSLLPVPHDGVAVEVFRIGFPLLGRSGG